MHALSHSAPTKATLSFARRRLLELMQRLNFGRIEELTLVAGEPVFTPPPRVVREIKFGGENGPRPELAATDFSLKAQIIDLFQTFDTLQDGTIAVLEIKHGLPFRMMVADPV
ncbi:MAG TPA: hypothetical protein VH575_36315 [Gemmataceae bacterium]|jgi:hypothetical protein